jgi:hypothetical protein
MNAAPPTRVRLPSWTLLAIAGDARLDVRTVRQVLLGDPKCTPRSRQLVLDAVSRLGVALPDDVSNAVRMRST